MPLYIAFTDLAKAFDLVSRRGQFLFQLLKKIDCPSELLGITASFHDDMRETASCNDASSEPFKILSGVKQGCVLAPNLIGIFFSMLLNFAFCRSHEGVHLHDRSEGKLFNLAPLKAKTKARTVLITEMLFSGDAALTSYTEEGPQKLISRFSHTCNEFGMSISI